MRRLVLVLAACGGSSTATPDAPRSIDAAPDAASSVCPRDPKAADRTRHVVISHPFDASGSASNAWEVLDLSATGELSTTGHTFQMGVMEEGEVAMTPDGAIGIAAQDDGSLGVFSLDDAGVPTVIAAKLTGSYYATRVVMAPEGDHAYVLDGQTRDNGGGIYRVDIACDGTVTDKGLVVASKLPAALAFVPGTPNAVVAAVDIASSTTGSAHLVAWGEPPTWLSGIDAFGGSESIISGSTLSFDGAHFLIGDSDQFSGIPNRIGVVDVRTSSLTNPVVIDNVMDPLALVASPFGDVTLVVSGFGNAMFVLDGSTMRGEVTYTGKAPELPGGAVRIDAGALTGMVLVGENLGVRRVQMAADGSVTDLGKFSSGSGTEDIVGAIGVTP